MLKRLFNVTCTVIYTVELEAETVEQARDILRGEAPPDLATTCVDYTNVTLEGGIYADDIELVEADDVK